MFKLPFVSRKKYEELKAQHIADVFELTLAIGNLEEKIEKKKKPIKKRKK